MNVKTNIDLKGLYRALLHLDSEQDCAHFLEDLCTPLELQSLADRWRVAQLLYQGVSYRKIQMDTGVSTATVTRVARCLQYGNGGYGQILKKMSKENPHVNQ